MISLGLVILAVLDGAFAGFRAAAGCNGRIDKRGYYLRAMAKGAVTSLFAVAALGGCTLLLLRLAPDSGQLWVELTAMGARIVAICGAFSVLVCGALALYALTRHEARTLATVAILGPFTLARPWVVVLATTWALGLATSWHSFVLTLTASAAVLGVGVILHRAHHHPDSARR